MYCLLELKQTLESRECLVSNVGIQKLLTVFGCTMYKIFAVILNILYLTANLKLF